MSSSTRDLTVLFLSRKLRIRSLLLVITVAACLPADASHTHSVTPNGAAPVDQAVRAFMQTVCDSVTQDGPMAWIKYFDASPAFFMAVNGQMAFPSTACASPCLRSIGPAWMHSSL
jgi:hypothetical protein